MEAAAAAPGGAAGGEEGEGVAPADIATDEMVFSLCWHPEEPLLAVGLLTGQITLHRIGSGAQPPALTQTLAHHTESCRALSCTESGQLLSASADGSIALVDLTTAAVAWSSPDAHSSGVSVAADVGEASHPTGLVATGDDVRPLPPLFPAAERLRNGWGSGCAGRRGEAVGRAAALRGDVLRGARGLCLLLRRERAAPHSPRHFR